MEVEVRNDLGSDTSSTLSNPSFNVRTEKDNQLKETNRFNDQTPEVRKAYTIMKQREKWTEEEHQKFLEAVKLYGRGWRKIEEHIGTKTAIQIRSHAQKFFSKVARASNNGTDGSPSVNLVEIPPPRPKRKPVYPYPRKLMNSLGEAPVSSRIESTTAKETPSPRSVLPVARSESDTSGSAASDDCDSCPSPNSRSTCKKENIFQDKVNRSFSSSSQNPLCFKIFGRTVMVTDITPKLSSSLDRESSFDHRNEKFNDTWALNQANSRYQTLYTVGIPPSCPQQWCSCQGLPYVLFAPLNLSLLSNGTIKEQQCASSDSRSITGAGDRNPVDSNSLPRNPSKREIPKGFVPYKRCLAQREGRSSIFLAEQRSQKPRVES